MTATQKYQIVDVCESAVGLMSLWDLLSGERPSPAGKHAAVVAGSKCTALLLGDDPSCNDAHPKPHGRQAL